MLKEFKEFVMRGNVLDLAVAVILGAAFGTIVKSLVDDILMPPIGMLLGGVDFTDLFLALDGESYSSLTAAQEAGAATINYGLFINAVINFLIVAFVIFLIIRSFRKLRREEKAVEEAPEEVTTKDCPYCQMEIALQASRCPYCTSDLS